MEKKVRSEFLHNIYFIFDNKVCIVSQIGAKIKRKSSGWNYGFHLILKRKLMYIKQTRKLRLLEPQDMVTMEPFWKQKERHMLMRDADYIELDIKEKIIIL